MRKNGFTLIELLAVIVILAIIALIATPIILGIINDAREKANERSVELYASAVRNAIASYQLTNANAPESFEDLDIQYDGKVECTVEELYSDGSFYLEGCKVNDSEKEYSYGTKQEGQTAKACSIEKQDASKYSKGDVVTCNIGDELDKFYVIEDAELSATTIKMLTEKNIHTTNYRQDDNAGFVAFSTAEYWSSEESNIFDERNDIVKPIVDEYVNYLNTKLSNATGSLLTYSQAQNLGCVGDIGACAPGVHGVGGNALEWVYSTIYWLGTTGYGGNGFVWRVTSGGEFMCDVSYDYNSNGVRPVITIQTSDLK